MALDWDPVPFQDLVTEFMNRRQWTQADLGRRAGIGQTTVNRWFTPVDEARRMGPTRPTAPILTRLAPILGVPEIDLLRLVGYVTDPAPRHAKPADPDLARVLTEIENAWPEAPPELRRAAEDSVRAILGSHRGPRPNRRRKQTDGNSTPAPEDSGLRVLTTHW